MKELEIIQGGMGVAVSNWRLANSVARLGQLGVVSGTALENVLARRLQAGDPDGHMRRALAQFPLAPMAERVINRYFLEGGKAVDAPFAIVPMFTIDPDPALIELTVVANFVEVFLAREGHTGKVGINYLEKIQMPTLSSLYGALLAGVDYVIVGAGIPREIPGALDRLARGEAAELKLHVEGGGEEVQMRFDPVAFAGEKRALQRPRFLAIVSSSTLAQALLKRATGEIYGFVVELPTAGGHNAPPRGKLQLNDRGEPVYGPRDEVDLAKIAALGKPFWMAGSCGNPGRLREVQEAGAVGVQVGTAFAFCEESGVDGQLKSQVLRGLRDGEVEIFTDPAASPTGFPFKVIEFEGKLPGVDAYAVRPRTCNLGYLRTIYRRDDGSVDYRCAAESVASYVKKGGDVTETEGRKCLCNALLANVGLPQRRPSGYLEQPLLTAGDDLLQVAGFLEADKDTYGAADVVDYLLAKV